MNYNELAEKAHSNAVKHGFWDKKFNNEHYLMLIISEVGEMVNADRKNRYADKATYCHRMEARKDLKYPPDTDIYRSYLPERLFKDYIKNSVEDEMADIAIRLLDLAGALGIDFDKMKPCRYYRAFDKFSFTENAFALCKGLARDVIGIEKRIQFGLEYVRKWSEHLKIDLSWHINEKMKFNENRPEKHGKQY